MHLVQLHTLLIHNYYLILKNNIFRILEKYFTNSLYSNKTIILLTKSQRKQAGKQYNHEVFDRGCRWFAKQLFICQKKLKGIL